MTIISDIKMHKHSPNYCSWLAVRVNYGVNFYCKIALSNRFKLYLINKITVRRQKTKQTKKTNKT